MVGLLKKVMCDVMSKLILYTYDYYPILRHADSYRCNVVTDEELMENYYCLCVFLLFIRYFF